MSRRVLVVEDDATVRTLLEKTLKLKGYDVRTAADGLDALQVVETFIPDVLVTDLAMPNLDGIGLVKALRSVADTARIPVIMLTARDDTRAVVDGINAGARFYVTKPFEVSEIVTKVQRAINA